MKSLNFEKMTLKFQFFDHLILQEISNEIGHFLAALFYSPQAIWRTLSSDRDSDRRPNFLEKTWAVPQAREYISDKSS